MLFFFLPTSIFHFFETGVQRPKRPLVFAFFDVRLRAQTLYSFARKKEGKSG